MLDRTQANLFQRYIWLANTIYRSERITFDQINEKWLQSSLNDDGEGLPLKTFHNHKNAIQQLFDICIGCDRRAGYVYYIENAEEMEEEGIHSWLLNTFSINNLVSESYKIKDRILFEQIPSSQRFLMPIIEAMRDGFVIEVTHQSYWSDKTHTFEVEPYCVKIFKQRWYVVANSVSDGKRRIYALDRIRELHVTENKFNLPANFDSRAYFNSAFGIIVDDTYNVEQILIRVTNGQQDYLRSLPLHHSQIEIERTADYSVFKYYLRPTFDFQQALRMQGAALEILSPEWLRTEFIQEASKIIKLYSA